MAYAYWVEMTGISSNSFSLSLSNIPPTSIKDNFDDCKEHIKAAIEGCDIMIALLSKIKEASDVSRKTFIRALDSTIISERKSKRIRLFRKKKL